MFENFWHFPFGVLCMIFIGSDGDKKSLPIYSSILGFVYLILHALVRLDLVASVGFGWV